LELNPILKREMKTEYDVLVVGSGPAGLFAAYELADKNLKVLVIEQGFDIDKRKDIMCGIGGAGTFSSGILNLRPDVGGNLIEITKNEDLARNLVNQVDALFLKFGAPKKFYDTKSKEVRELKTKAASLGIKFVEIPQRHIGTENSVRVIKNFIDYLKDKGIEFLLETRVEDILIENNKCIGVKLKDDDIKSNFTLLAPGRIGASWINELVKKHSMKAKFGPIDIGVRVEVPSKVMDSIVEISHDPKFHIYTKTYNDFVRTFCTNHNGFVVEEKYNGFIGVNGHTMFNKKSENTNFAFLVRIRLTEPLENTTEYGRSIAELATTIGGGKPIIQRIGDLKSGRRSRKDDIIKNPVKNTLKDVTSGDISMALPHRIVEDIIEGLDKLNELVPGIASDSTLLYAPEIKFYAMDVVVDSKMKTNIKNLFVAGDGVGLSRGIVNAAATGILAARGVLGKI